MWVQIEEDLIADQAPSNRGPVRPLVGRGFQLPRPGKGWLPGSFQTPPGLLYISR